jgi:hypothetical protein
MRGCKILLFRPKGGGNRAKKRKKEKQDKSLNFEFD